MQESMPLLGEEAPGREVIGLLDRVPYGVLCLSDGDEGYGVPLSFGYDEDVSTLYFELLFEQESKKRRFLETTDRTTFVVSEAEFPDAWASAFVTGYVERVPEAETATAAEALSGTASFPPMYTFMNDMDTEHIDMEFYRMTVAEITGRRANLGEFVDRPRE